MVIPAQVGDPEASDRSSAAHGVAIAVAAVLPVFLASAVTVQLQADLSFGAAALGGIAASFFVASAAGAPVMGQVVQRVGSGPAAVVAVSVSGIAMLSSGWVASWPQLALLLAVAGLANSTAQPTANLLISEAIPVRRLGLAFGIKQSCVPLAALLGGAAVPTMALEFGWRWTFWTAGAVTTIYAVRLWFAKGRLPHTSGPGRLQDSEAPLTALVILTVGGFLGAAVTTSLGTFLVDAAVFNGLGSSDAGWLYAALALSTVTARVAYGWLVDRLPTRSRFVMISVLLLCGASGYLFMATGEPWMFVVGSCIAFVLGWGWTGLFQYAIVTWYRQSAAAATGFAQTGLSLGAGLGPLVFGLGVAAFGYRAAWLATVIVSLCAGLTVLGARTHLRARRRPPLQQTTDLPPRQGT